MEEVAKIRAVIREDLETVGMIPTGVGIQLISQDNPTLGMSLYCEAIYVFLYNGRSVEEIADYAQGPLQLDDKMGPYIIKSAFRVRIALEESNGDHNKAYSKLMDDPGAEEDVIKEIIRVCVSTAREFKIPWSKKYSALLNEFAMNSQGFPWGCIIIPIILALVGYLIYSFMF